MIYWGWLPLAGFVGILVGSLARDLMRPPDPHRVDDRELYE